MAPRILCVGAATWDTIFQVPALPTGPTKVLPTACVQLAGGMAASGGAAIVRLGGHVEYWTRVGDDDTGHRIVADLSNAGLEVSRVRRVTCGRSPLCTILVAADGERLVVPFYDPALDADASWLPVDEVKRFDALLVDARWPAGASRVLGAARTNGVAAVLDADLSPPGVIATLAPMASHVVFSAPGLHQFTGCPEIEEALRVAQGRLAGFVGVTMGPRGFAWIETGAFHSVPAPAVTVVDTLSAGDVFHGAFALALAERSTIAGAARFACAAAAIKCTRFGGRTATPIRAEVEALLAR